MKALLYVADNFQSLQDGKVLAVGLYSDKVVILNIPIDAPEPSSKLPFGISLGLLVCLLDLPAEDVSGNISILPPSGHALVSPMTFAVPAQAGRSANIVLALNPFLVSEPGLYQVVVDIADVRISESFEIRMSRQQSHTVASAPLAQ